MILDRYWQIMNIILYIIKGNQRDISLGLNSALMSLAVANARFINTSAPWPAQKYKMPSSEMIKVWTLIFTFLIYRINENKLKFKLAEKFIVLAIFLTSLKCHYWGMWKIFRSPFS